MVVTFVDVLGGEIPLARTVRILENVEEIGKLDFASFYRRAKVTCVGMDGFDLDRDLTCGGPEVFEVGPFVGIPLGVFEEAVDDDWTTLTDEVGPHVGGRDGVRDLCYSWVGLGGQPSLIGVEVSWQRRHPEHCVMIEKVDLRIRRQEPRLLPASLQID